SCCVEWPHVDLKPIAVGFIRPIGHEPAIGREPSQSHIEFLARKLDCFARQWVGTRQRNNQYDSSRGKCQELPIRRNVGKLYPCAGRVTEQQFFATAAIRWPAIDARVASSNRDIQNVAAIRRPHGTAVEWKV